MKKLLAGAVIATAVTVGGAGAAFAGEVGGSGKSTPAGTRASSACAFSGLEDGEALIGFTPEGAPIIIPVEGGPGVTQTPHAEPAAGVTHPPGVAGQACRGNVETDI